MNSKRSKGFNQIDVRVGKVFRFGGRYSVEPIGEIFNLLNSDNPVKPDRFGHPNGSLAIRARASSAWLSSVCR